jgi:hypothetical protein
VPNHEEPVAWDVGSRNAADSATLEARASETTRVVTGAGVLRPKHVAAVTDALMYVLVL